MQEYKDLLHKIITTGVEKTDRTGTGTISIFGHQMRFDLRDRFPLVTTKFVPFKSVAAELCWFLRGSSCVQELRDLGSTIWDEWEKEDGTIGPMYGAQWKDQLPGVIHGLRTDPDSRRHVVSAWNVADLPKMALAPCHAMFQFYVSKNTLSCQVYQRSADVFLGVPFNIASYALLTHIVALHTGHRPGELIWTGGDCHLYLNHQPQAHELLNRSPRPLPRLGIPPQARDDLNAYHPSDFVLYDYNPWPALPAKVAV
jgi:thymidylate synthase